MKFNSKAWLIVLLHSAPNHFSNDSLFWDFHTRGKKIDLINTIKINSQAIYLWYPLPIEEIIRPAIKLLLPPNLKIRGRTIQGHTSNNLRYVWTRFDKQYIKLHPIPHPCLNCGWYCQQNC